MAVPLVILDIDATDLLAEVWFNGVRVSEVTGPGTVARAAKINGWAVPGANALLVRLGLLPTATEGGDEPSFELKVRRAWPEGPDESDEVLATYAWRAAGQPLGATPRTVFEAGLALGEVQRWSWTRGYAFTALGAGDRDGIADVLERLHRALAERRVEDVLTLQATQVGEQAIALGQPPATFLDGYRAFLEERMASPDWRVTPLDPAALRTELMADGRIVHATDAQNGPPIVTRSSSGFFAVDPYLSKIDGRWTIVR